MLQSKMRLDFVYAYDFNDLISNFLLVCKLVMVIIYYKLKNTQIFKYLVISYDYINCY